MGGETITGLLFIEPLYQLAYNIMILFYNNLGHDLGIAIIAFTLALRLVTLPFTFRQMKTAKKTKEFQKKYKDLQSRHKGDEKKLAEELAKLQAEYLPAQLGGCLPLLLQIVFFFQIYYVVRNAVEVGAESFNRINYSFIPDFPTGKVFDIDFFGVNLGATPREIGFDDLERALPYILLVLAVGATQFIAGKVSLQLSGADLTPEEKLEAEEKKKRIASGEEEFSFGEAMQQSSRQMTYMLPLLTMFFALNFPAGLALYWAVSSGFAVIQQFIIKWDQVKKAFNRLTGRVSDQVGKEDLSLDALKEKAEEAEVLSERPKKDVKKNKSGKKSKKKRRG